MSSYSREQLEQWVKKIIVPAESRVLDIGGSQLPIQKRLGGKGECTEYKILDLEQPHECKEKPDIICDLNQKEQCWKIYGHNGLPLDEPGCCNDKPEDVDVYDIPKYDTELDIYNNRFDIAFCLEVSEYWWNPYQALKNMNYFLKQNGILYISFHFIYPIHNPLLQDYLRYTLIGVKKLLNETGFEIVEETPRYLSEAGQNTYRDLMSIERMRPNKDMAHHVCGSLIKAIKK